MPDAKPMTREEVAFVEQLGRWNERAFILTIRDREARLRRAVEALRGFSKAEKNGCRDFERYCDDEIDSLWDACYASLAENADLLKGESPC